MGLYVLRRLLYSVPVFLGILLFLMLLLRYGQDPVRAYLGTDATPGAVERLRNELGLDRPFLVQYFEVVRSAFTLDFSRASWSSPGRTAGELLSGAIVPTLAITLPSLAFTALFSLAIALVCTHYRGKRLDRALMAGAALATSVSAVVLVLFGQYYGAHVLDPFDWFAVEGFEPTLAGWFHYCLLPVLITACVATGYEARFYRAALIEESGRDHVRTAVAKGLNARQVLLGHVLRTALLPIVARLAAALPFVFAGSVLVEHFFNIQGMGQQLIAAALACDFPVIESFTAAFAALFIVSNVLADVLYAVVDPRVRLA